MLSKLICSPPSPRSASPLHLADIPPPFDAFASTTLTLTFTPDLTPLFPLLDPALRDEKAPSPTPQRPSIRPVPAATAMRSNFDLELNPFEQSFRASSHHGSSSSVSEKGGKRQSPPRGGDETSMRHNALPPLSSLTSPAAADPSQFPWLAAQSLRAGPLSPAMLGGPNQGHGQNGNRANENGNGEHQAFDPSNFRTGFTPGTGSGFTPGYNSLMNGSNFSTLPLPSPNTAAFLNMVTNSTPLGEGEGGGSNDNNGDNQHQQQQQQQAQQQHGQGQGGVPSAIPPHMQSHGNMPSYSQNPGDQETITPGTFSALTGALNDMNRANGQHQQGPPGLGAPPYYNMNGPAPHHQMHHMPSGGHPHHPQPHIDYAQQSANAASQAANGLFLLSQAHQELSKREEETKGSTPLAGKRTSVGAVPPGSGKTPAPGPPPATGGQKRKSDASAAGPAGGTGGKTGKKGKKALAEVIAPVTKDESASPSFSMMMDDDDDGEPRMINGKPETEEDKRKNFLERNRQGEFTSSLWEEGC
jgi:ATF/CREB family transcription factor